MSTRSELEEERRLFYVAFDSCYQVYLTYAQSRYRWGKLTESEPSRFIEEIDPQYWRVPYACRKQLPLQTMMIDYDIYDKSNCGQSRQCTTENSNAESRPDAVRKLKPAIQIKSL
jgi:DNA helicase-2/ATP-dependent DNA helicase PcrA